MKLNSSIFLLILFGALMPRILIAQTTGSSLRTSANLEIKIAKALKLEVAPEYRFDPGTRASEYLLEAGLSYKVASWLSFGGYYRIDGAKTEDAEGSGSSSFTTSNRFAFDANTKVSLKRFTPKFRVRFCNFTDFDQSTDDKANYMRYRLGLDYNIKGIKITPFASVELYQKLSSGLFSQARYTLGGEYDFNKKNAVALSYSYSNKFKSETRVHIFELTYKFKF